MSGIKALLYLHALHAATGSAAKTPPDHYKQRSLQLQLASKQQLTASHDECHQQEHFEGCHLVLVCELCRRRRSRRDRVSAGELSDVLEPVIRLNCRLCVLVRRGGPGDFYSAPVTDLQSVCNRFIISQSSFCGQMWSSCVLHHVSRCVILHVACCKSLFLLSKTKVTLLVLRCVLSCWDNRQHSGRWQGQVARVLAATGNMFNGHMPVLLLLCWG